MDQSQTSQGAIPSSPLIHQSGFSMPTGGSKKKKPVKKQFTKPEKRQELIKQVFKLCDTDQDILLNEQEMGRFAKENGFEGGDDAWASEYQSICAEYGKG